MDSARLLGQSACRCSALRRSALRPAALRRASAALSAVAAVASLPAQTASPPPGSPPPPSVAQSITVVARPVSSVGAAVEAPTAQTLDAVARAQFASSPAASVAEVLALVPGVTFMQGNGPRDVAVSVRGSNERQTFGIRNAQVFDDGFPTTQPDGMARTDVNDPHAYAAVDVVKGPSSALYGNYATGGAILFRTREATDLVPLGSRHGGGLEAGADFGSFGYHNLYATGAWVGRRLDALVFGSQVGADPATAHNGYSTTAGDVLVHLAATPRDRLTWKLLANQLDTDLSLRLSLAQYRLNPLQQGCAAAIGAGCATVNLFVNGASGTRQALTAAQAGLGRHDLRLIAASRYERDLSPATAWRTQFTFDDRNVDQPTNATSTRRFIPSVNLGSDVVRHGLLGGHAATSLGGGFFNRETFSGGTSNLLAGGGASLGAPTQTLEGSQRNAGLRVRQELSLGERWQVVAGLGVEWTRIAATARNYSYPAGMVTPVAVDLPYFNAAPEVAVAWQPTMALRLHARLGTGYGTPQAGQLFIDARGLPGSNTGLRTQRNVGLDVGAQLAAGTWLTASLTGFAERFTDEQVTQSAGVNLQSYTSNAPGSLHRGLEAGLELHPLPRAGLRLSASYLLDRQTYRRFTETLAAGSQTATLDRAGRSIPGVVPHSLTTRLTYRRPQGWLAGLGGYAQCDWRDNYRLDNGNLLAAPGYTLVTLNGSYEPAPGHGPWSRLVLFVSVANVADRTWVTSASNLADTLDASGREASAAVLAGATGSVYAGAPRSATGGVRVRF